MNNSLSPGTRLQSSISPQLVPGTCHDGREEQIKQKLCHFEKCCRWTSSVLVFITDCCPAEQMETRSLTLKPAFRSFAYRNGCMDTMLAGGLGGNRKAFVIKIIQITWEGSHGYNIQSPLSVHIWRDLCVSTSSSCLNAACCQIAAV